ncbi:UDP-N-acetylglucosamine transferase subunit ALG14 homolog isoform X2 [Pseudorasbora parva]|uniref:UDP-N-acetylglucosamine transferase subunit ALG14 homolog isoform X2 n=1 Tax=Pseudorasbora parva TaxID=51549 RepID=UPI00351F721D
MALLYVVVSGVVLTAVVLITVFILRLFGILRNGYEYKPGQKGSVSVLVVAGSDTDKMSEEKIRAFEAERKESDSTSQFTLHRIPRSREVRQSWSSSVLSSLSALMSSVPLVFRLHPDMVLCNGPGTCVPLCAAGLLLGVLGLKRVLIVYVESICRVETLSLSGKILYYLSDYFFVQWAPLKDKYPKAVYLGRLV